jgi:hypothetical protein
MQLLWHKGDKNLHARNERNPNIDRDAKHQMMPILRITAEAQEKQQKNTVHVEDLVVHRRSSYERGDSSPPPPPGFPPYLLHHSHRSGSGAGGGGFFPSGAMGGGNTPTPTSSKYYDQHDANNTTSTFVFSGGGKTTGNKKGVYGTNKNGNSGTRYKCKSPCSLGKNRADGKQETDASMESREEAIEKGGIKNNGIIDPNLFAEAKETMNF